MFPVSLPTPVSWAISPDSEQCPLHTLSSPACSLTPHSVDAAPYLTSPPREHTSISMSQTILLIFQPKPVLTIVWSPPSPSSSRQKSYLSVCSPTHLRPLAKPVISISRTSLNSYHLLSISTEATLILAIVISLLNKRQQPSQLASLLPSLSLHLNAV